MGFILGAAPFRIGSCINCTMFAGAARSAGLSTITGDHACPRGIIVGCIIRIGGVSFATGAPRNSATNTGVTRC